MKASLAEGGVFEPPIVVSNRLQITLLMSLLLFVPLVWLFLLGWQPGKLIPQGDFLKISLIYQREFSRVFGDWTQMLYWPGLGGGVKVHDVTGSLPIAQLMSYFQVDLVTSANAQIIFMQTIFGYLCACCAVRLPQVLTENLREQSTLIVCLAGLMFAFLPVIGWRVAHGHDSIVIGLFTLLCFLVLLLDEITGKRSLLTTFVSVVALCHAIPYNSFQLIHYSLLFGAPIVLGIFFAVPRKAFLARLRWTWFPIAVFLAALLISLPKLYGILANGLGDESSRSGSANVVYSYTVASWQDWLSSLPWTSAFLPDNRQTWLYHEINYPLGALALLMVLASPGSPLFRILAGLGLSLVMALVLSVDIRPFSTLMIDIVPFLESFRVPARAILPFVVAASILGVAVFLDVASRSSEAKGKYPLLLVPVFLIIAAFNYSIINELLLILAVGLLFLFRRKLNSTALTLVFSLFVGASIAAFKERAFVPLSNPVAESTIAPIRESLHLQAPELTFPLNRVHTNLAMPEIGLNSHFLWDVSSLSSYWFPLERYTSLVMALEGLTHRPTQSLFSNQPDAKGFDALNRLFNVGWEFSFEDGEYRVRRFGSPYGPAWLSSSVNRYDTWGQLADAIIENRDKRELLLLSSDRKARQVGSTGSSCVIQRSPNFEASDFPYEIELAVQGECYLTVSMNYTDILLVTDQGGNQLRTFPAYGSLLGVVVNQDVSRVSIEPVATRIQGSSALWLLGWLLSFVLLGFAWAMPAPESRLVVEQH